MQSNWFATSPLTSTTVSLTQPVQAGDLLVGWFSQYGASGQVQVSDNVERRVDPGAVVAGIPE